MPNRDSRPTPVTISLHTDGGSLSWVLSEIGEETLEGTVNISSGKILGKGKLPIPQRPTKLSGVSGLPGAVLPKGRLAALVRAVTEPGQKDTLCWAVLRRYANWYGCYPKPPHRVRKQAYEVIRRAWDTRGLAPLLAEPAHRLLVRRCATRGRHQLAGH